MNHPVATFTVLWLGAGMVYLFWNWKKSKKSLERLEKEAGLPTPAFALIAAVVMVFTIFLWPPFVALEVRDRIKRHP